jgi:hypothetical protein
MKLSPREQMALVSNPNRASLVAKFMTRLRDEGPVSALRTTASFIRNKFPRTDPVRQRRVALSNGVSQLLNATVAYGPFKGLKLVEGAWWGGGADRASMLLGLYELEIVQAIATLPPVYRTFIDIGAADGYYGLGVLVNQRFARSFCFEISEQGREAIARNAAENRLTDKVTIHGEATRDFHKILSQQELQRAVLLVDIEGGEFDIFDSDVFRALRQCVIFIEMHEWQYEDGANRRRKLMEDASLFFSVTEMTTTARDLSQFPELRAYSDTDRWLMCSEGRPRLMTWLRLDPLSPAPQTAPALGVS